MSPQVLGILQRLEDAGYETWCVGGAIRDAILGDRQHDVDLATAAPPGAIQRLFRRTVPIGIEHGTVGVLDDVGTLHEVTTFRRDVQTDGRHAVVEFGTSLDEDLARRDFTVNAIAFHPVRGEWRDPFDGRADIAARILRAVGNAATRFREDRLRILRLLRFAARFDFAIEPGTWAAATDQAGDTRQLSAERVRDEWIKGLHSARTPTKLLELWKRSGVAEVWLPECDAVLPEGDLQPRDAVLLTAVACSKSSRVWRRLKGSTVEVRRAEAIDAGPAAPAAADARTVRHWLHRVGDAADDLVAIARWQSTATPAWIEAVIAVRSRGEATARNQLAVTGADLLAAGVSSGPVMGKTLDRLLRAVLDDPALNAREALLALALEHM